MFIRLLLSLFLIVNGVILLIYINRPASIFHQITLEEGRVKYRWLIRVVIGWTVLACIIPMGLAPLWNGQIPGHRNQYEKITESFLKGQLYFDDEVSEELLGLENPYDPQARWEAGANYRWDHAYYNGHYYMYFGVVPVFLLFLPYRVITGTALTTYHATQVFTAVFIIGLFFLFRLLAKKYFPGLSLAAYISMGVAFSALSVWYASSAPALYCTAITSAICLSVWSLYFFIKAVLFTPEERKATLYAVCGAALGALEFGCRPTIALSNLLVLPLLVIYLKKRKFTWRLVLDLCCAALPYVVVAVGLMYYNYARFGNPFEFGQAYQLTVADQSGYGSILSQLNFTKIWDGIYFHFLNVQPQKAFIEIGLLISFPILLISILAAFRPKTSALIRQSGLVYWIALIPVTVLLIVISQVAYSPVTLVRYRSDFNYLLGIKAFMLLAFFFETSKRRKLTGCAIGALSAATVVMCAVFLCVPNDANFTDYYWDSIQQIMSM